jgi:hypothetical protein
VDVESPQISLHRTYYVLFNSLTDRQRLYTMINDLMSYFLDLIPDTIRGHKYSYHVNMNSNLKIYGFISTLMLRISIYIYKTLLMNL